MPIEWIGRARALRAKIVVTDAEYQAAAVQLLAPFRPRPGFAPMPRHQHLERLAQRWKALPTLGRLRRVIKNAPGDLQIAELRAHPFRMRMAGWTEDELALVVTLRAIRITPPAFNESNLLLTATCLHALARRYERGADRTDAAVLRDLPLGQGYDKAVLSAADFAIPAPSGGKWIGAVALMADAPVLMIRTFIE